MTNDKKGKVTFKSSRDRNMVNLQKRLKDAALFDKVKRTSLGNPQFSKLQNKYITYKDRIESKGKEFSLSFDKFCDLLSGNCTYCGGDSTMTIDRIDSSIGYTLENSTPCCLRCNTMKWSSSKEEFFAQIKKISDYNSL